MRKSLITMAGMLACLLSSWGLQAATVLTFEVVAERRYQVFGTDTSLESLGTETFLVDIVLDDSAYTYTDVSPSYPEYVEDYREGRMPVVGASGLSEEAKANYVADHGFTNLTVDSQVALLRGGYTNESSPITINEQEFYLGFGKSEVHETLVAEDWVHRYTMSESLTLRYDFPAFNPDAALDTPGGFEALLASLLNQDGLFEFSSGAYYRGETCAPSVNWCGTSFTDPSPALGEGRDLFTGTATLVGISAVPLPGAAWLMLFALGGLVGTRRLQQR